jgi:hypothetical protein
VAAAGALIIGALVAAPSGALAGSNFESADGNEAVDTTGNFDWSALGSNITLEADQPDTPSGSSDESFTQGTKSDTAIPTIETGSIPPNKSDLTRMRVASETLANGDVVVYVAWNRANTLGSANMNFEFNKSATPSDNGVTPVRSAGDVLITFDFANGGNVPSLGMARWTTTGPCYANGSKAPCWGEFLDLDAAGIADGQVSEDGKFGEAAVNLTDAGIFGSSSDECTSLGSAYLSSRSSDSFTAALKDFVPPAPISISNCGTVTIRKVTVPADNTTDVFTFSKGFDTDSTTDATFDLKNGESKAYDDVLQGTGYTVSESSLPTGWSLTDIDCSASSGVTPLVSVANKTVTFDIDSNDDSLDCTFENTAPAKLIVKKVVNNTAGGPKQATDFAFSVNGETAINFLQDGGDILKGRNELTVAPGIYTVTEPETFGYDREYDNCANLNIPAGGEATCTITNKYPQASTSASTVQSWVLKDELTIVGFRAGAPTPGTVTFELYKGGTCTAPNLKFTETVTDITSANVSMTGGYSTKETGDYSWVVTYSGDEYNLGSTSACGAEIQRIQAKDADPGHNQLP